MVRGRDQYSSEAEGNNPPTLPFPQHTPRPDRLTQTHRLTAPPRLPSIHYILNSPLYVSPNL